MAMVKSVLGVNYKGLRDWFNQRFTAIFLAIYSLGILIYFIKHPQLAFYEWHGLFVHLWMKIMTLLFITCLLLHGWIGMWTVITDYIKPFILSLVIQVTIFLAMVVFFFEALIILWGI